MFSSSVAEALGVLLSGFLQDQSDNVKAIEDLLRPRVNRYCAKHAYNLPHDLREDVLQEFFLYLLSSAGVGQSGTVEVDAGHAFNLLRSALRSVRRRHGLPVKASVQVNSDVELDELPTRGVVDIAAVDGILVDEILRAAGPRIGSALWRIYGRDEDPKVVLREHRLSRFTLMRRRKAIAQQFLSDRRAA